MRWLSVKRNKWIFSILFLIQLPISAQACRCQRPSPDLNDAVSKQFTANGVIFLGDVLSIMQKTPSTHHSNETDYISINSISSEKDITVFNVRQLWKGDNSLSKSIILIDRRTDCTYRFKIGKSYLVYAYGPDKEGYFSTSVCSLTTTADKANPQIKILNTLFNEITENSNNDYFGYGCGGGIAARYPEIMIFRDGRLQKKTVSWIDLSSKSKKVLPSNPALAKEIFERLRQIDLDVINGVNEPASFNCYFHAKLGSSVYSATWGGGETEIPIEIEKLGRFLYTNPAR